MAAHSYQPNALERRLIDGYQCGLPLEPRPFARIGRELGITEQEVIGLLQGFVDAGVASRVGAVLRPNRAGVSTLAALAVPEARLEAVAELVSSLPEVNHNYEREHTYNLWFVVTASDRAHLHTVLDAIADETALEVLELPMLEEYFIDLGFQLQWP